jgi:hypothetical protein
VTVEALPRREELEALAAYYHHLQNEHHRAPPESGPRRRIEDELLEVRERFDRLLEEWVPEEELRESWRRHLDNREAAPDGPEAIWPLVFAGRSEVTGSVVEIRELTHDEFDVWVDGSLIERIAGEKDFSVTVPPVRFRLNDNEFLEIFNASDEALEALAAFRGANYEPPPWAYATELLSDGLIDTHFSLTPRGHRAISSR